jgi:hypothetical protein
MLDAALVVRPVLPPLNVIVLDVSPVEPELAAKIKVIGVVNKEVATGTADASVVFAQKV